MRPLIIAAFLCTYSACSCGSQDCLPAGAGGFPGSTTVTQLGYVGKPVTVEISVIETFSSCNPAESRITGAVVEVLDPGNQKVAATVTQPVEAAGQVSCTVTFTPATPGPYHVAVRLAPNGGTQQRDVMAAVDRRSLAPNTFPLGPDRPRCDQIDFDGQTLLCHDVVNEQLLTMRLDGAGQGKTVSMVPGYSFALSEGKVWVFDMLGGLSLYGLGSDGSLAPRSTASIDTQGVRTKILAEGDQAFFIDDFGFQTLTALPDGGISSSGRTPLLHATGAQWVPALGATVFSDFDTVCSWALTPGVAPEADAGSCSTLELNSVQGYDDDGIWWIDPSQPITNGQTVFVSGWHSGHDHPTSGALTFLGAKLPFPPSGGSQQVSLLLSVMNANGSTIDTLMPRFDGKLAWFEQYPTIDTVEPIQADSRYIWFIEDNVLTYYRR